MARCGCGTMRSRRSSCGLLALRFHGYCASISAGWPLWRRFQVAGNGFSAVWNNDLLPFFQKVGKWFSDTWNKAKSVFDSFKTWFLANWKTILDVVRAWTRTHGECLRQGGRSVSRQRDWANFHAGATGAPAVGKCRSGAATRRRRTWTVDLRTCRAAAPRFRPNNPRRTSTLRMGYNGLLARINLAARVLSRAQLA